jgi:hypothetical protein
MKSTKMKVATFASTAALAVTAFAATAQADTVKVTGGETELKLSKSAKEALEALDLTAEGTAYEVKGGAFDFAPIDDGGGGVLKHKGALTIESEEAVLKLKGFQIDLAGDTDDNERAKDDQGVLTAKIGGEQTEVGRLNTRRYESDEKQYSFSGLQVSLTKEAAKALNKTFDVKDFEEGIKLGKLSNQSEVK